MRRAILLVFALSLVIPVLATGTTALAGPKLWTGTYTLGSDEIKLYTVPQGKKFILGTVTLSQHVHSHKYEGLYSPLLFLHEIHQNYKGAFLWQARVKPFVMLINLNHLHPLL